MKEKIGNIWNTDCDYIAITTNAMVNFKGELVMGKGIALQAKQKYPELPIILGTFVSAHGNRPKIIYCRPHFGDNTTSHRNLVSLPTKYNWKGKSDINLIKQSLLAIKRLIESPETIAIPRPGCSNGKLNWSFVKKEIEPILNEDRFVIYSLKE